MEHQPWNQQQQREGGGFAMGDSRSCHAHAADFDQQAMTTDPCEVDGALLIMELMEDLPSSDLLLDGDVDRQLSHVIRSLEAEIGGGDQQAAVTMADVEGGESLLDRIIIEDAVFSADDMDGYDYQEGASSSFLAAGHDEAEGWCVYANANNGYEEQGGGFLAAGYYYDTVDHHCYCCSAEGSADHMYLPLWE